MIKNLAQLKRTLVKDVNFEIMKHHRQEFVGQHRRVNFVNTTGFYSIIPNEPNSEITLRNNGRGIFLDWGKARFWKFEDGLCSLYNSDKEYTSKNLIISIKVEE